MRKIIGSLFQSLDGVIQAPGGPEEDQAGFVHGGWVFPYFDESLDEPMGRLLGGSYELLLGRRTYEIFAAYWPHNGDQPIGETFNAVGKHVVTSADRPLTWNNSQRLVGDPAEAVARLKASDGPDLLIRGSSMLYRALLPARRSADVEISKPHLHVGAAEGGVDLPVELMDDLDGRISRCADAVPGCVGRHHDIVLEVVEHDQERLTCH